MVGISSVLCLASCVLAAANAQPVLVEAESFAELGGWVVDQQAIDQMGSPYVLAHGLGVPVADAQTEVELPGAGTYRVWVRTRDWVANFGAEGAPGRFELLIDGTPLPVEFGTKGAEWHWQDGGTVKVDDGNVTLTLHDLTGFEGRCDAIVFAPDAASPPPNASPALDAFRKEALSLPDTPPDAGKFDLVVVGGGMAGSCAAISAARLGLDVALVQNRPVLGGNNSSEVRVHLQGQTNLPPYPQLGNLVRELDSGLQGNAKPAFHYDDAKKLNVAGAEDNLSLFLNMHAFKVEKDGNHIAAVIAKHTRTGEELRFPARLFADCTGDGAIGYLAGADWRMGRESRAETGESLAPEEPDKMTMGASVQWYSVETEDASPFPECPWAEPFTEETCQRVMMGEWDWETGMNRDQVADIETIRDHAFRVIYGNWAFLKNHSAEQEKYANRKLDWVAYVAGKRESRRLLGDVILQEQDIVENKEFPDACVTTTWTIDLHYPEPENTKHFPGREFRSIAEHKKITPYPIPYRCLYSRNVDNLFMAGRDISVTHVALGTVRVMRTGGMMGEVVGMAASLCIAHDTLPRGVYENHLEELKALMHEGVGTPRQPVALHPPEWRDTAGANVARDAAVTVSSTLEAQYVPAHVNDGEIDINDSAARWVSGRELPHTVEFTWDQPQRVGKARIVSGWRTGPFEVVGALQNFALQYWDGAAWRDFEGGAIAGNTDFDWSAEFETVETSRVRLVVNEAPGGLARLWEVELYE